MDGWMDGYHFFLKKNGKWVIKKLESRTFFPDLEVMMIEMNVER